MIMGKLIVFEGIDGSGKSTQFKLLCDRLEKEKREFKKITFPQYSKPSSALIKMYLAGEFGSHPDDVNPYAASAFYAVDRFASYASDWKEYYNNGGLLMSDRYTTSNAIHQSAKLDGIEKKDYLLWLYDFEFKLMGLPKPDAVTYMNVPVEVAINNIKLRSETTNAKADIHELDEDYLARCCESGYVSSALYGWKRIDCAENGKMRPVDDIASEIYDYIEKEVL